MRDSETGGERKRNRREEKRKKGLEKGGDHANQVTESTEWSFAQSFGEQVSHHRLAWAMGKTYDLGFHKFTYEVILNLNILRTGVENGF